MKLSRSAVAAALAALVVLASVGATCMGIGNDGEDGGDGAATKLVLAPIESADILIRESFPPQYAVEIVSGLPSGCAQFHAATAEREGDLVRITVQNRMPASDDVACTMIYGTHESTVELGSDFEPGKEYTVRVNDYEFTFTAQ